MKHLTQYSNKAGAENAQATARRGFTVPELLLAALVASLVFSGLAAAVMMFNVMQASSGSILVDRPGGDGTIEQKTYVAPDEGLYYQAVGMMSALVEDGVNAYYVMGVTDDVSYVAGETDFSGVMIGSSLGSEARLDFLNRDDLTLTEADLSTPARFKDLLDAYAEVNFENNEYYDGGYTIFFVGDPSVNRLVSVLKVYWDDFVKSGRNYRYYSAERFGGAYNPDNDTYSLSGRPSHSYAFIEDRTETANQNGIEQDTPLMVVATNLADIESLELGAGEDLNSFDTTGFIFFSLPDPRKHNGSRKATSPLKNAFSIIK